MSNQHEISGMSAERVMRQRSKFGGSYHYHTWHWRVLDRGSWRGATSAEARMLNRSYGHTPGYAGPNHPSYRPY